MKMALVVVLALLVLVPGRSHAFDDWVKVGRITPFAKSAAGETKDLDVVSPKSVLYSPDGAFSWVQALERGATLVYDVDSGKKIAVIEHSFAKGDPTVDKDVFEPGESRFRGKPVESVFTHEGRYVWITSYRKDWDAGGRKASTVAVVDTKSMRVIRVMRSPAVPKFIAWNERTKRVAVVGWGDNSIDFWDASNSSPAMWALAGTAVVGHKYAPPTSVVDRDKQCGFCLRGSVFDNDGKWLMVARMGGGGISIIDARTMKEVGVWRNVAPTPRHLALSPSGKTLFITSNAAGVLTEVSVDDLIAAAVSKDPSALSGLRGRELRLGSGARTLAISKSGDTAFVALNFSKELVAVDLKSWRVASRLPADPFPVGIAVSPRGDEIRVTSQGRSGVGGHVVSIWRKNTVPPVAVAR